MFEQGLGGQCEYSQGQGHSKHREHRHGKEEHGAKTGLGDIRLGYKCSLSPLSAGLPTASCCSHLFSCFAIPCAPKPAITSPFPLLHLLTSCPQHMGTWDKRVSKLQTGKGRGVVQERGWRAQEWQAWGPGNPVTAFLHLETFLAVPWPTSCFAKWFWLMASLVLIQRKYIKPSSSLNERKKKKKPHRLFTKEKENVWKKKILKKKKDPIKILIHRLSLSNHHQVMLISMNSSQMLPYKDEKNKMQLQHSCVCFTYTSQNMPLLTWLYLVSDVLIMKTIAIIWKMLFSP